MLFIHRNVRSSILRCILERHEKKMNWNNYTVGGITTEQLRTCERKQTTIMLFYMVMQKECVSKFKMKLYRIQKKMNKYDFKYFSQS